MFLSLTILKQKSYQIFHVDRNRKKSQMNWKPSHSLPGLITTEYLAQDNQGNSDTDSVVVPFKEKTNLKLDLDNIDAILL